MLAVSFPFFFIFSFTVCLRGSSFLAVWVGFFVASVGSYGRSRVLRFFLYVVAASVDVVV